MRIAKVISFAALSFLLSPPTWGADLEKGQEAYFSGDYQTALAEWQPLAEEGQAEAQFGMGLLYANGFGVPLNDDQAHKWYLLAAEQGHADAQCHLAVIYANGWGVPQSSEEAFKWYRLAAEQGLVEAQKNLARMYSGGYGTDKDNIQALKWFEVAAELGDDASSAKRDDVARAMSADEISNARLLATEWLESHYALLANE
jgi:uncharacterized protein